MTLRPPRAQFCKACILIRKREQSNKNQKAARRRKARMCRDCGQPRPMGSKRYCRACAYARFLRGRRAATEKYRKTRPRFVYCPEDQPFADWLDKLLFQRPMLPPDLNHEPETWQPFNVPDYLR